jgi:hypothetical protein
MQKPENEAVSKVKEGESIFEHDRAAFQVLSNEIIEFLREGPVCSWDFVLILISTRVRLFSLVDKMCVRFNDENID